MLPEPELCLLGIAREKSRLMSTKLRHLGAKYPCFGLF